MRALWNSASRDGIIRSEFAAHPLGVIAAPEHPLAALPHIPPALLDREPFIVREPGSGTRAAMERYFAEARIKPASIMVVAVPRSASRWQPSQSIFLTRCQSPSVTSA